MVIKDKALIKRMARDFKTGTGYTLARDNSMDGEPTLYMHGIGWTVQILWEKVPATILAQIVNDMRDLPQMDEAFTLRKDEEPTSVYALQYHFPEIPKVENWAGNEIRRTPIHYGIFSVWQKKGNDGCLMFDDKKAGILEDKGNVVLCLNRGLYLEGLASRVFVESEFFLEDSTEANAVRKLSKESWA